MVFKEYLTMIEAIVIHLFIQSWFSSTALSSVLPINWSTEIELDSPSCDSNCPDVFAALRDELNPAVESKARQFCGGKNELHIGGTFESWSIKNSRFVDGSPTKGRATYIVNGDLYCAFETPKFEAPPDVPEPNMSVPKAKVAAHVQMGQAIILGALDKGQLDTVIKRNINQIRYCYQRELVKDLTLSGQIVVKFTVSPQGDVTKSRIKSSSMDSSEIEACVAGRFKRFSFPEPKGGGIVIVSYPFLFSTE